MCRGLLHRTPRTTSSNRLQPVFRYLEGSLGSRSPTSYWSMKTHTSCCALASMRSSTMCARIARAASATGAGAMRPTTSSPWAALPTEAESSEEKSSRNPTTGPLGVSGAGVACTVGTTGGATTGGS